MTEKIKTALSKLIDMFPSNLKKSNMRIYYGAIIGFVFLSLLFIAGWLFNWRVEGKADLPIMISFITLYLGPCALAFISTMAKKTVDKDGDGVSDDDEKGSEIK